MSPSLNRMIELVPPPTRPVAPGSPQDWIRVELDLGVQLPSDFKEYTASYGAGQWADFFGIYDPFYTWRHPQSSKSWADWRRLRLGMLDEMRKQFPKYTAPFSAYPAEGGLLAFGYNDNGGTLCWQVGGAPDSWRIICLDGGLSEQFGVFDMPLTEFLLGVISEQFLPHGFAPDLFPISRPAFRPYTTE